MSESQDYNADSSKEILQPNNSIMLTMTGNHKRTMSSNELEPPIKRKKEFLVATEKVITNVHNNNSPNSKTVCSTTRCTTILNSVTAKDARKAVATEKVITNVHNNNSQNLKRVYSTTRCTQVLNSVTTKDSSAGTKKETQREISSIACQTENFQILSICNLSNNPKAMKFYTGFKDYEKFMKVFQTLGPDKYDLKYYDNEQPVNLSHLDQFLVVLILLKQHKSHYEISIMFNITLKDIKNIFITWIRFMRLEWRYIKIKEDKKMHQKVAILNNSRKVDVENNSPDPVDCLKKTYKILLNGPANYIESHLAKDIQFVCERLYHFTTDNNGSNNTLVKSKQSTKNIELKHLTRDNNNSNNILVKLTPPTKNIELKQCFSAVEKSDESNQKL